VWGALGLYPTTPGVGGLTVGSPLFPRVAIALAGGAELVIEAPDAAPDRPYVKALRLDGAPIERTWLEWDELAGGATLSFDLEREPTSWAEGYRPPSFTLGTAAAIGYLGADAVSLPAGGSATVTVGAQSLADRALTVTCEPEPPEGLTLRCEPIAVPAGGRAETTLTLHADAGAQAGVVAVDLGLHVGDEALPPAVVLVEVTARRDDGLD
jgi:hypothetical protein